MIRAMLAAMLFTSVVPPVVSAAPVKNVEDLVTKYCAAWSQFDAAQRDQLLNEVWSSRGTYTDPTVSVTGRPALSKLIEKDLRSVGPGTRVVKTSTVDSHHNVFRFTWKVVRGDNSVVLQGMDFGVVDDHGRISRITGSFGAIKPSAE